MVGGDERLSALEQAGCDPRDLALARDLLRLEIVARLGGVCVSRVPGTYAAQSFRPSRFESVAASLTGFEALLSDGEGLPVLEVIAAPARHPVLRLWQDLARLALGAEPPRG